MRSLIPPSDGNMGEGHRHARADGLIASPIRPIIPLSDEGFHSVAIQLQGGVDAEGGANPAKILFVPLICYLPKQIALTGRGSKEAT